MVQLRRNRSGRHRGYGRVTPPSSHPANPLRNQLTSIMPYKAKVPCRHKGCPELVDAGFCSDHAKEQAPRRDTRPSAWQRGYDQKWRSFRLKYIQQMLKDQVTCTHCKKPFIHTKEIELDHVVPLNIAPERKYDKSNIQPLCKRCHMNKTRKDQRKYEDA